MDGMEFISKALRLTRTEYQNIVPLADGEKSYSLDEFYCVWMNKTLQNAKGLFASNRPDKLYAEVTYNGDKDEFYVDVYHKISNRAFSGQMVAIDFKAETDKEGI